MVVLGNDAGGVDHVHRIELKVGVVVHKVVKPLGAHQEGGDALAGVERFFRVVDDAGLDQIHHAVAEQLGVQAQILLVLQELQHCVRDGADAQLKGVAVLDQASAVFADPRLGLADVVGLQLGQRGGVLYEIVDLGDGNAAVAVGIGHLVVHLGDDQLGLLNDGLGVIHADAQRAVAIAVGRGDGHQRHVHGQEAVEHPGHPGEGAGGEIRPAVLDGLADDGAGEDGVQVEVLLHPRLQIAVVAHGHHLHELHILIGVAVVDHGVHQIQRLRAGVAQRHPVAGLDVGNGLLGRHRTGKIKFSPVHNSIS